MNFKGKLVLITGAYRGIGKTLAESFAKAGAGIILTYHEHKEETDKLVNKLKQKYHVIGYSVYVDLKNEKSIKKLHDDILDRFGKLDILVNNSALSLDNFYLDKTKEEFMEVMEVNVVGTFLMIRYFDTIMDHGYIFNISSTDGIDTGNVYSVDYNASKAAINSLTKTISLVSKNRIISICPNWVDTISTVSMDKEYLKSELKRINQDKLISRETIFKVIEKCIKEKTSSGTIIRVEGDDDVREVV